MAKRTNTNELSRRYVTAVFDLANSKGLLAQVADDLAKIQNAISDSDVKKMLSSPLLTSQKQVAAAKEIASIAGIRDIAYNFLLVVARNRRLANLSQIIDSFVQKIEETQNQITAKVFSAHPLSDENKKELEKELSAKTGKTVKVKPIIDETIIGGIIIKIGSKMYDSSIKTKLTVMAKQLRAS